MNHQTYGYYWESRYDIRVKGKVYSPDYTLIPNGDFAITQSGRRVLIPYCAATYVDFQGRDIVDLPVVDVTGREIQAGDWVYWVARSGPKTGQVDKISPKGTVTVREGGKVIPVNLDNTVKIPFTEEDMMLWLLSR